MIDFITMPDFIRLAYIVAYTISAYIVTKLIAKAPVGYMPSPKSIIRRSVCRKHLISRPRAL